MVKTFILCSIFCCLRVNVATASYAAWVVSGPADTLVADTNKLWFDKSDCLLISLGLDQRNYDIRFLNSSPNLLGVLGGYVTNQSPNLNWKFFPTINQNNASVSINTRYVSLAYTKAIKPIGSAQFTDITAFNFSIPYRHFSFTFDYLKFTGLNRVEPVYKTSTFLKDMVYNPISINVEYTFKKAYGMKGGKPLRNSLYFVPKKFMAAYSIVVGGLKLTMNNPDDFIPGLMYKNNVFNDSIIQVNGVYVNKFTSTGFFFGGPKAVFVAPLVVGKNTYKPRVLYLKGMFYYGLNSQKYEYHVLSDKVFTSTQFVQKQKGFGLTKNFHLKGSLIYDINFLLIGISASFDKDNYGDSNEYLHVAETQINYNAFLSFRLGANKIYGKIESVKRRILK